MHLEHIKTTCLKPSLYLKLIKIYLFNAYKVIRDHHQIQQPHNHYYF